MPAGEESYEARPFLKIRRAYIDNFDAARRKNFIHGLVEMDVTDVRRSLRHLEAEGKDVSFSAVVMHAVARAVDEDRIMHAYRRRNQLILFDDVDVNTQIEVTSAGQKIVKPLVVRPPIGKHRGTDQRDPSRSGARTWYCTPLSSGAGFCEHPEATTQARPARRDVQPPLVQTVWRHGRPEFGRDVRGRWRLGHSDRPAHTHDHGGRHRNKASLRRPWDATAHSRSATAETDDDIAGRCSLSWSGP